MRVDFVITELFVGGAERCLTELALGLAQAGDQVRVFSLASLPDGDQRVLVDRLDAGGISVETGGADSWTRFGSAYRRLRDWFAQSVPDVAQTFLYHANVMGTHAARASRVDLCVGGLRVAESKPLRCLVERAMVRRMDSLVCVSDGVRQFARQRLDCPDQKSIVIPNGVDVDHFASATKFSWSQLGWPEDAIVTLFVGRLHRQKGIETLQDQIDHIAPPNSQRRLLMVGDGPLRERLQRWATAVGSDRVKLLGWQPNVVPLLRACRVLVLPSHYEGMPNVVLEAMAAGRPVVCSRVEGIQELLSHAWQQQSYPTDTPAAMNNLIEQFLLDEVLCDQVGSQNRSRVANEFSLAAMIDAYRRHYSELRTRRLEAG